MSLYSDLARFDFLSYLYLCLLEIVYSFMIVILFTNSNMDCIFNWRRFKINVGRRSLYSLLLRVLHSLSDGCHMVGCPIVVHGSGLLCWMVQWYMVLLYLYPTMVHSAPLYSGLDQYTVLLQCYIDRPDQHTSSLWPVLPKYTFTSNEFTILILISSNRILAEKKLQKKNFLDNYPNCLWHGRQKVIELMY